MAIYNGTTNDTVLNSYLAAIRSAEYGKDARSGMAASVERCYQLAVIKAGGARNGITSAHIAEHSALIRSAVFGEEVRDALKMGLQLVYSARGVSPSSTANSIFDQLIYAQTGEDLKNNILMSIVRCCQEVNR